MRRARATDPWTSWAATFATEGADRKLRTVILSALRAFGPMTHEDLIQIVEAVRPASPSGVRTRTSELVRLGLVEAVPDMQARTRYGRTSLLWRAVP